MKRLFKIAAYCCGGMIGVAAAAWDGGWCSGTMFAMLLIGCGCGLFVALHELAVIRAFEEEEKNPPRIEKGVHCGRDRPDL